LVRKGKGDEGRRGVIWWKAIATEREGEMIAVSTDAKRYVLFLREKLNLPIAYKGTLSRRSSLLRVHNRV
jgi:hypothetical protein